MKRLLKTLGVLVLGLFLLTAPAFAFPIIDFGTGIAGKGGVMVHVGANVSGTGIGIGSMDAIDTPLNSGTYAVSGAFPGGFAVLDFDTGIKGNFIKITGGVPALGIANGTVLLSGSFKSVDVSDDGVFLSIGKAAGPDVKAGELLDALGLPVDSPFHFTNGFSISAKFTGKDFIAFSTDIPNSGKIPEPISLILLGSGLAGAGLYRRLRKPRG